MYARLCQTGLIIDLLNRIKYRVLKPSLRRGDGVNIVGIFLPEKLIGNNQAE